MQAIVRTTPGLEPLLLVQDPHWIEYVAAIGGLAGVVLALVAAGYSKRSADRADEAVALAHDEVDIAKTEHEVFLRRLQARARFQVEVRPTPEPENGVIRVDASTVQLR